MQAMQTEPNLKKSRCALGRFVSVLLLTSSLAALACGQAFAWMVDEAEASSSFTIEVASQKPYAALYGPPDSLDLKLVFGRSDEVPMSHEGDACIASWRGMEDGTEGFLNASVPWVGYMPYIISVVSDESAQASPIRCQTVKGWFKGASSLQHADASGITPSSNESIPASLRSTDETFSGCSSLEEVTGLDLWNVSQISSMNGMFLGCSSLHHLDLTGWKEMPCANFSWMFANCSSLTEIRGLDGMHSLTDNWAWLIGMFKGCASLKVIDLGNLMSFAEGSSFNVNVNEMLYDCPSLVRLDISSIPIYLSDGSMFGGSTSISESFTAGTWQFYAGTIPEPRADQTDGIIRHLPYWVCDLTQDALSTQDATERINGSYSYPNEMERLSFHVAAAAAGPEEPYVAIYDKGNGSSFLVMGKGAEVPPSQDGLPLKAAWRGFCVNAASAAEQWRAHGVIADAKILCPIAPTSTRDWFKDAHQLTSIEGLEMLDMSKARDVTGMLSGCAIESITVPDWNIATSASGISQIFEGCASLKSLDVGNWTSGCSLSLGSQKLGYVRISSSIQSISGLNSSTDTGCAFDDGHWYEAGVGEPLDRASAEMRVHTNHECQGDALVLQHEKLDRSYAALYAGTVGDMLVFGRGVEVPPLYMGCLLKASWRGLEEAKRPASSVRFELSEAGAVYHMQCPWGGELDSVLDARADTGAKADPIAPFAIPRWFEGATGLKEMDDLALGLDVSRVKSAEGAFANCSSLMRLPASIGSGFTSCLTDATMMLYCCASLTDASSVSRMDLSNVRSTYSMFQGCASLPGLDISGWDMRCVTSSASMFRECSALAALFLPNDFVSAIRPDALFMTFDGCHSLTEIDATGWDASACYSLQRSFYGCSSLASILGAESWATSSASNMQATFQGCSKLSLDCRSWDVSKVVDHEQFRTGADGVLSPFDALQVDEEESLPEMEPALDDEALEEEEPIEPDESPCVTDASDDAEAPDEMDQELEGSDVLEPDAEMDTEDEVT